MTCAPSEDLHQSDQSSLGAYWVAKDPSFLHVDSEHSDQTGQSSRCAHRSFCWFCHEAAQIKQFRSDQLS